MRIDRIGSGISGMVAAYLLSPENEVTVFYANDCIGGHTHTIDVPDAGQTHTESFRMALQRREQPCGLWTHGENMKPSQASI